MNPYLNEERLAFRNSIRKFFEKEIKPLVYEYDQKEEYPEIVFQKCAQLGLLGVMISEKYGGTGPDCINACILMEEMARIDGGITGSTLHPVALGMPPIFYMGTEEQKEKYLIPAVKGEIKICFAITEPVGGSDNLAMQTTAKSDGDSYVINGSKIFSTNGGISDYICVACKTNPENRSKGISVIIIPRNTPGFAVGKNIKKIGWHTSNTVELFFNDCRVSKNNLIGEEGTGFINLMKTLHCARIIWSSYCIGIAQGAFEEALKYSQNRLAFGHLISKYQGVSFPLADMAKEIEVARNYTFYTAHLFNQGVECNYEASIAKLFASEMAERVTSNALQIHGGYGFCREYPVSRYFCDSKIGKIGEGTSEIMKILISRKLDL